MNHSIAQARSDDQVEVSQVSSQEGFKVKVDLKHNFKQF